MRNRIQDYQLVEKHKLGFFQRILRNRAEPALEFVWKTKGKKLFSWVVPDEQVGAFAGSEEVAVNNCRRLVKPSFRVLFVERNAPIPV